MKRSIKRRDFLKSSAIVGAAVPAVKVARGSQIGSSDSIGIGVIGVGRQGFFNMLKFQEFPECRIIGVSDVYQPHLDRAREETGAEGYRDFRHLLDRKDVDAVIVSSPDHWHPLMSVMACQAGKDVYVEKPVSIAVDEGRKMVEAAHKYKRVVQVGTMQRSGRHFQKAVQLIRSGEIGRVTSVRTWILGNDSPGGIGSPPDSEPPASLDWDLWLGPASNVPFNVNRFGVFPDKWSTFRFFWDYAGGMMTDWGVHLLDIVQWAMDVKGPVKVNSSGGKYVLRDNRETPDTLTVTLEYPDFICTFENRACNNYGINGHRYGIEFYGTEGTLFVNRSGFEVFPQTREVDEEDVPRMYSMQQVDINDSNYDHVRDFLDCMKTRGLPICDIETGHRSTTTCLLANISYLTGRCLIWDAERESIRGDDEANAMLTKKYRSPWKLEV